MDRDHNWMNHKGMGDRKKPEYVMRVNQCLEYTFSGKGEGTELRRPSVNGNLCLFKVY